MEGRRPKTERPTRNMVNLPMVASLKRSIGARDFRLQVMSKVEGARQRPCWMRASRVILYASNDADLDQLVIRQVSSKNRTYGSEPNRPLRLLGMTKEAVPAARLRQQTSWLGRMTTRCGRAFLALYCEEFASSFRTHTKETPEPAATRVGWPMLPPSGSGRGAGASGLRMRRSRRDAARCA
jgi:hypothetical protein